MVLIKKRRSRTEFPGTLPIKKWGRRKRNSKRNDAIVASGKLCSNSRRKISRGLQKTKWQEGPKEEN